MRTFTSLDLADARRMIGAGKKKAAKIKSPSNIAVVDAGGHLLAFERMDGAPLASIGHAIDKAHTSVLFAKPSGDLAEDSKPSGSLWGVALSGGGRAIVFGGGLPIISDDGAVVGAIGVSGGTVDQDVSVAEAGHGSV